LSALPVLKINLSIRQVFQEVKCPLCFDVNAKQGFDAGVIVMKVKGYEIPHSTHQRILVWNSLKAYL